MLRSADGARVVDTGRPLSWRPHIVHVRVQERLTANCIPAEQASSSTTGPPGRASPPPPICSDIRRVGGCCVYFVAGRRPPSPSCDGAERHEAAIAYRRRAVTYWHVSLRAAVGRGGNYVRLQAELYPPGINAGLRAASSARNRDRVCQNATKYRLKWTIDIAALDRSRFIACTDPSANQMIPAAPKIVQRLCCWQADHFSPAGTNECCNQNVDTCHDAKIRLLKTIWLAVHDFAGFSRTP